MSCGARKYWSGKHYELTDLENVLKVLLLLILYSKTQIMEVLGIDIGGSGMKGGLVNSVTVITSYSIHYTKLYEELQILIYSTNSNRIERIS